MAKPRTPKPTRQPQGLPDRETLLKFIRQSGETDKAAIARAFGLKGADRRALREMLGALQDEGALGKRGRRGFAEAGQAPGLGDRLLVRFTRLESGEFEARLIKKLGQSAHRVLGVVRKARREIRLEPVDRRSKDSLVLSEFEGEKLRDGDLVVAQVGPAERRYGPHRGKVLEVVGREDEPRAASLIAIHAHGIPTGFSQAAEAEAEAAEPPTLAGREDLRDVPLVTIDPPDARDHDDAVYAQADPDEANPGGWIVWVAIADVAAYVRSGSALDREARDKGNSVYFPDRVEPMLPERLSNGLCSLREGENRACMAVRMVFGADGRKRSHRFVRGLMRSAAKLSYEQAQAAIDGAPDDKTGPLLETILKPLWAAHATLMKGRAARSPVGIESTERRVRIGADGKIDSITPRASLEAHKLIEEMMIQANVSAAETLEARRTPLIYRIHDEPSPEKLQALGDFLATLDIAWTRGETVRTERFNRLLDQVRDTPNADIVNEVVLRTQMQAHYSDENIGHFGLNLQRYAHFTSPIRRYADLIVHRALIRALGLGDDGLTDRDMAQMKSTAEMITFAERRGMAAERDAMDRYIAAFLADHVGAEFDGKVTGVTRFGLFVRLAETGADGLVPVSTLGGEYFVHDDRAHALVGERTGVRWLLGMTVRVRLTEATPVTGGLLFEMLSDPAPPDASAPRPRLGMRARGDRRPGGGKPGRPPGVRTGRKQKMGGKKRR